MNIISIWKKNRIFENLFWEEIIQIIDGGNSRASTNTSNKSIKCNNSNFKWCSKKREYPKLSNFGLKGCKLMSTLKEGKVWHPLHFAAMSLWVGKFMLFSRETALVRCSNC